MSGIWYACAEHQSTATSASAKSEGLLRLYSAALHTGHDGTAVPSSRAVQGATARPHQAAEQSCSAPAKGPRGPTMRSLLQSWLGGEGLGWLHHANSMVEAQLAAKGRGGTAR